MSSQLTFTSPAWLSRGSGTIYCSAAAFADVFPLSDSSVTDHGDAVVSRSLGVDCCCGRGKISSMSVSVLIGLRSLSTLFEETHPAHQRCPIFDAPFDAPQPCSLSLLDDLPPMARELASVSPVGHADAAERAADHVALLAVLSAHRLHVRLVRERRNFRAGGGVTRKPGPQPRRPALAAGFRCAVAHQLAHRRRPRLARAGAPAQHLAPAVGQAHQLAAHWQAVKIVIGKPSSSARLVAQAACSGIIEFVFHNIPLSLLVF